MLIKELVFEGVSLQLWGVAYPGLFRVGWIYIHGVYNWIISVSTPHLHFYYLYILNIDMNAIGNSKAIL